MEIDSLFAIPVGSFQLSRQLQPDELACVHDQQTRENQGNTTSCNTAVLDEPRLTEIRHFIDDSLTAFTEKVYNPKNAVAIRITQSWCNYSCQGDFHPSHSHSNSFLSGVFYFESDPEADSIRFFRREYQPYKIPPRQWNHWIADSSWFAARPGRLLLFPSSLPHRVDPIQGAHRRVSLAFNTFPVGDLGDRHELTALHLQG